jgi:translocation and assembly module TamB
MALAYHHGAGFIDMILRKVRNIFFSLLALLLILLATVSALVETETGSRWVVKRLASVVNISVGEMSGNLRSGMDLAFIDYTQGEYHYHAEQVSFRWRPAAMLYSVVAIQSLRAQNVLIQVPAATDENKNEQPFSQWPSLALPVRIFLDQVLFDNIDYVQGDTRQQWKKISGSLSLGTFRLRYKNFAVEHADYKLLLSGATNLRFPYDTGANLQWQWQNTAVAESLVYMGVTELKGDLTELHLHNQISLPMMLNADASVQLVNELQQLQTAPSMTLALAWQEQALPAPWWIPAQPQPMTSGNLTATGNWQAYKLQLDGNIHLPDAPALAINATANGDTEKIQIANLFVRELHTVDALASNAVNAAPPAIAATPLTPGNSNERGLQLAGEVRWLPQLEWQLNAGAKRLNLASVIDNWPSNIDLSFQTRGARNNGVWNAEVQDLQLSGELRGVNVQGDGDLFLEGKKSAAMPFILLWVLINYVLMAI